MKLETFEERVEIAQKAFELFIQEKWFDLENYAVQLGISTERIKLQYIDLYARRLFNSPKPPLEELKKFNILTKKFNLNQGEEKKDYYFIYELLSQDSVNGIIQHIANSKYDVDVVFEIIKDFVRNNPRDRDTMRILRLNSLIKEHNNDPELRKKLITPTVRKKSEIKQDTLLTQETKERYLKLYEVSKQIIEQFINQNSYTLDEFIIRSKNLISHNEFRDCMKLIYAREKNIIEMLRYKIKSDRVLFEQALKIMLSSLEETNLFSILDYYRLTTIVPESFIFRMEKLYDEGQLTEDKFNMLSDFFKANEPDNQLVSENYLTHEAKNNLDITERQNIIQYIRNIPAPLTVSTFKAAYIEIMKHKTNVELPKSKQIL